MNSAPKNSAELPVRSYARRIVDTVRSNPFTVIIGETGSGKTTQISQVRGQLHAHCTTMLQTLRSSTPEAFRRRSLQILQEAGFADNGQICVTQPRRVVSILLQCRLLC